LRVLHFHLGSQVANIADIQRCMHEGVRYYETLRHLGAPIDTIDVGGGLSGDYEGTRSRSYCSMNYSIQEYANNIVYTIADICNQHGLSHPQILTESGRAMTAHHALLITDVIAVEPSYVPQSLSAPESHCHPILHEFWESYHTFKESTAREAYHDACHWLSEMQTMYIHGLVDLKERAFAEQLYYATCAKLKTVLKPTIRAHREILDEVNQKLAHKFVCNFSLFQSLPDSWAINQVFPILPLAGLNKQPSLHGVIHDITCDSDGLIDTYVNNFGLEHTLPVAPHDPAKPYLFGMFLVGAYQEILGDLHNLFGDTHSVHVELRPDGNYELTHLREGDTVAATLRHVDFNEGDLLDSYRRQLNNASLTQTECDEFLNDLETGLKGYTYFEE
jgi:arginine decarboxylase